MFFLLILKITQSSRGIAALKARLSAKQEPLRSLIILVILVLLSQRTNLLERLAPICFVLTPVLCRDTYLRRGAGDARSRTVDSASGRADATVNRVCEDNVDLHVSMVFQDTTERETAHPFGVWGILNAGLIVLLPDLGSIMILFPVTLVVFTVMTSEYILSACFRYCRCRRCLDLSGDSIRQSKDLRMDFIVGSNGDDNRQIVYGLQAVSRGGLFGRGLGNGSPGSIPLANSDMIFAIVSEEFGMIVGVMLILLYMTIWLRGMSCHRRTRRVYERFDSRPRVRHSDRSSRRHRRYDGAYTSDRCNAALYRARRQLIPCQVADDRAASRYYGTFFSVAGKMFGKKTHKYW